MLTGCQNMDSSGLLSSGAEAFQAYSLSDAQVKKLSDQACQEMDSKATIAPANSEYARRLTTISRALGDNINGQPVNYKVYMAKDVNAFAMANGCIRVYSGLMDMMKMCIRDSSNGLCTFSISSSEYCACTFSPFTVSSIFTALIPLRWSLLPASAPF